MAFPLPFPNPPFPKLPDVSLPSIPNPFDGGGPGKASAASTPTPTPGSQPSVDDLEEIFRRNLEAELNDIPSPDQPSGSAPQVNNPLIGPAVNMVNQWREQIESSPSSGGGAPSVPNKGPYIVVDGEVVYVDPPQGFIPDTAGRENDSGWVWNPAMQQYQRVEWDYKDGRWYAHKDKFRDLPTTSDGKFLPGLPILRLGSRNTPRFDIAANQAARVPGSLTNVAQSPFGANQVYSAAGGVPVVNGQQGIANINEMGAPSQVSYTGQGVGIGVDTAQTLNAYGITPTGDAATDQALTTAVLDRRAELEAAGLSPYEIQEIVSGELSTRSAQRSAVSGLPELALPVLDSGGIVTQPTIAMLAANGVPEVVIPLNQIDPNMPVPPHMAVAVQRAMQGRSTRLRGDEGRGPRMMGPIFRYRGGRFLGGMKPTDRGMMTLAPGGDWTHVLPRLSRSTTNSRTNR